MPFSSPQVPYVLAWDRTLATAERPATNRLSNGMAIVSYIMPNQIKHSLVESDITEGCGCLATGYSQFTAFMSRSTNDILRGVRKTAKSDY